MFSLVEMKLYLTINIYVKFLENIFTNSLGDVFYTTPGLKMRILHAAVILYILHYSRIEEKFSTYCFKQETIKNYQYVTGNK